MKGKQTTKNKKKQLPVNPNKDLITSKANSSLAEDLENDIVYRHSQACLQKEGRARQLEAVVWSPHTQYPHILLQPGQRSVYEHTDDIPSHVQPYYQSNSMQHRSFFASQRNYNRRVMKYVIFIIVCGIAAFVGLCTEIYVHQPRDLLVLREEILNHSYGKVLELGAGQGSSIGLYPYPAHEIWMMDKNLTLLKRLVQRLPANSYPSYHILHKCVEDLTSVPDGSFDTVIDFFGLCHYHDPVKTLQEMQRVCKKDGVILLLEHGRTNNSIVNYVLDHYRSSHALNSHGCIWDRDIQAFIKTSGLRIKELRQKHFGTTTFCVGYPK
ncbi:hypothetical protein XU18_0784 [Perkinsela sp. CCAP 1560/4]|nr:hypothetical protein XU18_0784 [Perkinsela sp. CCAP 1560/4]|eukprot:KNH08730.1 hypothetical protein XU18_0784 [Perkinsela sp. CCAP 1560/4]